ncbi:hypothetical protein Hanom_Chr12g01072041 [Helianthus anomalus]
MKMLVADEGCCGGVHGEFVPKFLNRLLGFEKQGGICFFIDKTSKKKRVRCGTGKSQSWNRFVQMLRDVLTI